MNAACRLIGLVGALSIVCPSFAAFAADAPKPDSPKPAATATTPAALKGKAVALAVAALQKEYQAYLKDPQAATIRTKCDYFKTNPSDEATPEAIMKGLEGSVAGGPGVEAYVKWQLLSGVAGKFPDDLLKRALAVYRRAPFPEPHPGMEHRALARMVNGYRKEQIVETQAEFNRAVEHLKDVNHPILAYRDELFARLPVKLEAINIGLEDVSERAGHGLNVTGIFDNVSAAIRSWAITEAKSGQVRGMTDTVMRLRDQVTREDAKPFTKIEDAKPAKWKAEQWLIDPKKFDELIKFLENNANTSNGGGGLKFKEPPKK
jgi:hypothetical protein